LVKYLQIPAFTHYAIKEGKTIKTLRTIIMITEFEIFVLVQLGIWFNTIFAITSHLEEKIYLAMDLAVPEDSDNVCKINFS